MKNESNYSSMAKGDSDKQWIWIMDTIYNLIESHKLLASTGLSADDVVQDTVSYILERKKRNGVDLAEHIYNDKESFI